jgi:hypothetical protein
MRLRNFKILVVAGISLWGGGFCAHTASAHVPVLIHPETVDAITMIEDPDLSQAFYGTMVGFPHTFEINATESFTLFTQILQPDIESSVHNISGIIIQVPEPGKRVKEITRLNAKDAGWESEFEFFGGDTYIHGPQFETELGPGTYRIEVHTPDNLDKYVLVVGKREEMTIGYIELIRRLAGVKEFFDKSQLMVVQSPFVYVPLLGIGLVGMGVWHVRRRKKAVQ